jgi:hypothetical protein
MFTRPLRILHSHPSIITTLLLGTTATATATTMSSYTTSSTPKTYAIKKYEQRHSSWPYTRFDFQRQDESPDTHFYASPKYVTHIDDNAIESLSRYYDDVLPKKKGRILDFCSSWVSHYPERVEKGGDIEVWGMGLNSAELAKNPIFGPAGKGERRIVQDLNEEPLISLALPADVELDASTCVVSIDYLSKPLEVLSSLREKTVEGGTVHLAISNRAFWHKVIRRWREVDEEERLMMVADYLHFAGWKDVEIVTVCPGGGKGGILGMIGMTGDPLWVVRGRKTT